MSGLFLALTAVAMSASPPSAVPAYSAHGSEPFWHLEIAGGRMTFSPSDGNQDVTAVTPRRQATQSGYRYVTRWFTVLVRHDVCENEAERRYRDTVWIRLNAQTYVGCGGPLLPPATLANTDWRIVSINGTPVDGDAYVMQFDGHRLSGQAGCNRFNGPYTQHGPRLSAGQIAATRMACPGPRMAHERGLLQLLGGPVQMSWPAGDVLVLTGNGGVVRLRRV